MGNAWAEIRGPQNGDSTRDDLEGQAWTYDEANMAFDESISEYLSLNCTFGVFLCMLGYCVVTLIWFIILIGASDVVFLLSLAILFLPDYFAHFICVDSLLYVVWLALFFFWLAYYLDCLLSMMFVSLFVLIVIAFCVDMSDISCTLLDCMARDCLPSAWLHVACLCGPHIYPLTSNSLGFGHSFHPGSHYCKCETFYVLALWPS